MRLVLTFEIPSWFATPEELADMTDDEIIECAADDWLSVIEDSAERVERTPQELLEQGIRRAETGNEGDGND